jgi:CheY-like chemotaxis protein
MKNRRILLIDDDPSSVRVLEKWLRDDGYEVVGALSGQGALKRVEEEVLNGIVIDLMIPDLNGVELARAFKANEKTSKLPMVFITATMGVEVDKGNEQIDIDGNLYPAFAKPVHRSRFLSVLRKEINRSESNQ